MSVLNLLRRIPRLPSALTLLVLATAVGALPPVRDAVTGADVSEAFLVRSLSYSAIAPASNVLDTVTLLSAQQHIALLAGVLVLFGVWRVVAKGTRRAHLVATGWTLGAVVLVYACAAFLPRPMASLETPFFADVLKVDFHAHTDASHDGRQTVNQLRSREQRAGMDVAFISDHRSVAGAERALLENPVPVGLGVTLLQSIETTWNGEHVSIPGAERTYKGLLNQALSDVDTQSLRIASFVAGREPIVIWNHPRVMDRLKPANDSVRVGVGALEIVNGSPKDRDFVRRNRAAIIAMAQANDIPLVSGSDNHGIGYAAPGWTLMVLANWRAATPEGIALAIERVLRKDGFSATKVIERRVVDPSNTTALALTAVSAPVVMLRTLSFDERAAWIVWIWVPVFVAWFRRRRSA